MILHFRKFDLKCLFPPKNHGFGVLTPNITFYHRPRKAPWRRVLSPHWSLSAQQCDQDAMRKLQKENLKFVKMDNVRTAHPRWLIVTEFGLLSVLPDVFLRFEFQKDKKNSELCVGSRTVPSPIGKVYGQIPLLRPGLRLFSAQNLVADPVCDLMCWPRDLVCPVTF